MIVETFAGPGGVGEGARLLGLDPVGIELDADACATRAAAGHRTIRADVAAYPTGPFRDTDGLWLSPPCQDFSLSNARTRVGIAGARGSLVAQVLRWVDDLRPRWVACEQVPPVLPIWEEYARELSEWGYSCWVGILNAADYGVPQTRRRAFLLASLDRDPAPPEATHSDQRRGGSLLDAQPWVTMAEALGWDHSISGTEWAWGRPSTTVAGTDRVAWPGWRKPGDPPQFAGLVESDAMRSWPWTMPATTVTGDPRISARNHHEQGEQSLNPTPSSAVAVGEYDGKRAIKITLDEALVLQSFRPGYPVQGTKGSQHQQIGNAVPPLLAAHVLAAVSGTDPPPLLR